MPLSCLVDHFNNRIHRAMPDDVPRAMLQLCHGRVEGRFGAIRLTSMFQPVLRAAGARANRLIGHAALLRAYTEDERPVGAGELFSSGADLATIHCLDRLCRAMHLFNYRSHGDERCCLFLHVDPRCVLSPEQGSALEEDLRLCGLLPERVVLQVRAKGVQGEDFFRLAEHVAHYRSLGYRVAAVEDARISHSGLDHLWRLPPHVVKLDRSLVVEAVYDEFLRNRLSALLAIIHRQGGRVRKTVSKPRKSWLSR